MIDVASLPTWGARLITTIATLALAWVIGYLAGRLLEARLPRLVSGRHSNVLRSILTVVRRRAPWWALLVGGWVAAGFWPLTPEGRVLIERLIFVAGTASVVLACATIAVQLIDAYSAVIATALPVSSLTRNVAWSLVVGLGLLVMLNGLGVSITPMLTALGIGGLAVALALQEPLANFFAGVFITLGGQIRVGDYVKLDSGQEGYVADFSWRSTRLRMLPNNLVIVPNAKLAQAIVINHHLPSQDLAVLVEVGVDYDSDLQHVERVVAEVGSEVMREVAGGVPDFEPFIRYHTFADSSVNFTVILRAREFVDQYLVKHEFIRRLHARFASEGITIPFPIRTLVRRQA